MLGGWPLGAREVIKSFSSVCMRSGDAANLLMLANTLAFVSYVLLDSLGALPLEYASSVSFKKSGFCVANQESPLLQSHILCFYVDTLTAMALFVLGRRYADVPGIKDSTAASASPGIFGHGLAHLALWAGKVPAEGEPLILDPTTFESPLRLAVRIAALWAFFFALLRSLPSISPRAGAIHAAVHSPILALLVPPRLGFTYVQTALLAAAAAHELLHRDKDKYYDLAAIVINLPVGFVSWGEALACDTFLGQQRLTYKSAGGHWLYDGTINVSILFYFAIVLAQTKKKVA